MDPYSSGQCSGRNAPPDALSANQNAKAQACTATPLQQNLSAPPAPPSQQPSPSQTTSSTPLYPSASAPVWYPIPVAYPGMYAQASAMPSIPLPPFPTAWSGMALHTPYHPYHQAYPVYLPHGCFPPSQPR